MWEVLWAVLSTLALKALIGTTPKSNYRNEAVLVIVLSVVV